MSEKIVENLSYLSSESKSSLVEDKGKPKNDNSSQNLHQNEQKTEKWEPNNWKRNNFMDTSEDKSIEKRINRYEHAYVVTTWRRN